MNLFEKLYETLTRQAEDKQYFSGAFSAEGRRYSEHYITLETLLGKGGFGFVRSARLKGAERALATKVVDRTLLQPWQLEGGQLLEAAIISSLSHPNIVQVIEVFHNQGYFLLVMPECLGQQLWNLVHWNRCLGERAARAVWGQVVVAVDYLHRQGITHNDIKDENLLVSRQGLVVTIIDFGSAVREDGQLTRSYCGSETYTSPEVLAGKRFHRIPQEIWSLGVLLWVMVYGQNPFENVVEAEQCQLVFPSHVAVSQDCNRLLCSILTKDAASRPGLASLLADLWLATTPDMGDLGAELLWQERPLGAPRH